MDINSGSVRNLLLKVSLISLYKSPLPQLKHKGKRETYQMLTSLKLHLNKKKCGKESGKVRE